MDKCVVKLASSADASLLVWRVPAALVEDGSDGIQMFCLPLMSRPGGAMHAVPVKVLSSDVLLDAMLRDEQTVGPSQEFMAQMMAEEEIGSGVVDLDISRPFIALDFDDAVLKDI